MKHRVILFVALFAGICFQSCHNSVWDEMPAPIAEFVARYFPEQDVSEYGSTDDGYHVRLQNSAAITFNNNYYWLSINGYGETLPQMLLFDELPPALYEHLQAIEELGNVYAVSRDTKYYFVRLLDSDLSYNIATDEITRQN
ncbi:MAG: hypothetical protein K2L55_02015 [Muribaculaceae bacterium]|nr:hypothetical protein [Muribaculaceae bacterium]MDE6345431.1 hypothetical protein [Muribaculaceae bacterium]